MSIEPVETDYQGCPFGFHILWAHLIKKRFHAAEFAYYIRRLPSGAYVLEERGLAAEFSPPFTNLLPVPKIRGVLNVMEAIKNIQQLEFAEDKITIALVQRILGDYFVSIEKNTWVTGMGGDSWIAYAIAMIIEEADESDCQISSDMMEIVCGNDGCDFDVVFQALVRELLRNRHAEGGGPHPSARSDQSFEMVDASVSAACTFPVDPDDESFGVLMTQMSVCYD
jgi:hypothetical protein